MDRKYWKILYVTMNVCGSEKSDKENVYAVPLLKMVKFDYRWEVIVCVSILKNYIILGI